MPVGLHVSGFSHTGTTLLVRIIRSHPEVLTITAEHNFFTFLSHIRRCYPKLESERSIRSLIRLAYSTIKHGAVRTLGGNYYVDDAWPAVAERVMGALGESDAHDHVSVFYACLGAMCTMQGKKAWVDKVNPRCLQDLDSRDLVLCTVRDPRAVVASHKARRDSECYSVLLDAFRYRVYLRRAWSRCRKLGKCGRRGCLWVKYEELVLDPEGQVQRVFEESGFDLVPGMWENVGSNSAYESASRTKGVHRLSIEKWKQVLSPREIAIVEGICHREMDVFGYSRLTKGSGWGSVTPRDIYCGTVQAARLLAKRRL